MMPWTGSYGEQEETTLSMPGVRRSISIVPKPSVIVSNLATGAPRIWIAFQPLGGSLALCRGGRDRRSAEGEAFTEAGADLVEAVPMPEVFAEAIENFVAGHHVETSSSSASVAAPIRRRSRGVIR